MCIRDSQLTVGKVDPEVIEQLVIGFAQGCIAAGCALTGGEIAEHPDTMGEDDFDVSGFAVGIAELADIPNKSSVVQGDILVGLASPGLRCNGYSLARRVLMDGRALDQPAWPGADASLGEELLRPSIIYAPTVLSAFRQYEVHAAAHITGGGLIGNLRRVIGNQVEIQLDVGSWRRPEIFDQIANEGPVSEEEMRNVFNLGIGMVLVVPRDEADSVIDLANKNGNEAWSVGQVVEGNGQARWMD